MLIRSIDHLQKAVPVANTLDWEKVKPWVMNAQVTFIRPILGKDLIAELDTAMDASPTDIQQELIDGIQFALGNLALMDFAAINMGVIGDGGTMEVQANEAQGARQWVTVAQIKTMIQAGFRRLEDTIVFLEENVASFESWKDSVYYTEGRKRLVPNALVFDQFYKIGESAWLYYQLLPYLRKVEEGPVLSLLGSNYLAELRTKLASDGPTFSAQEAQLLSFLRDGCCNLAMAKGLLRLAVEMGTAGVTLQRTNTSQSVVAFEPLSREEKADLIKQAEADGNAAMEQARNYLYANAEDSAFATWKTHAWVEEGTGKAYVNDPESGIFVTGI
jgi:hypothetical protein